MGKDVKHIKYGELEKEFFGCSYDAVQDAKSCVLKQPKSGKSAGNTFMQAYFGHKHGVSDFCESMESLCLNTRKRLKDSGAIFKDIEDKIARSIEKEG